MKKSDFEILFQEAAIGMAFLTLDGGWMHVNRAFCDIVGYTEDEVLKVDFQSFTHPDDLPTDLAWIKQAYAGDNTPLIREKRYRHKDGHTFWINATARLHRDDEGNPSFFTAQIIDVSEKKKALDQQLKTESRMREIMNAAADGIIMASIDGNIESFNDGAAAQFGYHPSEVIGKPMAVLIPEPHASIYQKQIEAYMERGGKRRITASRELVGKRKDGSTFPFLLSLSAGESHGEVHFVAITHDISDIKAIQEELEHARNVAEDASRAKTEFLSSMSHELRTPLNGILGFAQLLHHNRQSNLNPRQLGQLEMVISSGQHLLSLVNEVLDLSRVEAGGLDLNVRSFSLMPVVNDVVASVTPIAREQQVDLICEVQTDFRVNADELRLKQALINLVSNAIKYNVPEGWVKITVEQISEDCLRLEVIDSGLGIPPDMQEKVFIPFERLDADKSEVEGTGVGLALTKSYIEAMEGQIGLTSSKADGTTFWIELPVGSDLVTDEDEQDLLEIPNESKKAGHTIHVLYIEDNPVNHTLVRDYLEHDENIKVDVALNGEEGLRRIEQQQPDILLLDIRLPGMNGFEIARKLKGEMGLVDLPIIGVTAEAMDHDVKRAQQIGFDDYFTKPLDLEKLYATILQKGQG